MCIGRKPDTRIAGVILALALTALSPAAAQQPDIEALLDASLDNALTTDRESWASHAFRRHVTRQRFDEDGDIEWRQEMLFQVTPNGEYTFDEELLELDGLRPAPKLVAKHRKAQRFSNHFRATEFPSLENPFGKDLELMPLIYEQEHVYVGIDEVHGVECHRLQFRSRPEPTNAEVNDKLRYAMEGDLCISREGQRLIDATVATVREVDAAVNIISMKMHFQARRFDGAWLPTLFELRSHVNAPLGMKFRTHNVYRYSDFEPLP
jgi:hypothetical protein